MLKHTLLCIFAAGLAIAEVHSLTLREAVATALKENPGPGARAPGRTESAAPPPASPAIRSCPKCTPAAALAKVWGYPSSIEGSAPAIIQARTDMALFNKPKSYELARVRENARGAAIATQSKADEIAYQTASLFLDAQRMARSAASLKLEAESLERVTEAMKLRVEEGRELPTENLRVGVDLARARQRYDALADDLDYAQASLAVVLGYPAGDRVEPSADAACPHSRFPTSRLPPARWRSITTRRSGAWNRSFRPRASR